MEDHKILDSQISASSEWNHGHRSANGRLNFQRRSDRTGAWSSLLNDVNQWFQVDFLQIVTVIEIITQGRADHDQWVKSYTISYGNVATSFWLYEEHGQTMVRA